MKKKNSEIDSSDIVFLCRHRFSCGVWTFRTSLYLYSYRPLKDVSGPFKSLFGSTIFYSPVLHVHTLCT